MKTVRTGNIFLSIYLLQVSSCCFLPPSPSNKKNRYMMDYTSSILFKKMTGTSLRVCRANCRREQLDMIPPSNDSQDSKYDNVIENIIVQVENSEFPIQLGEEITDLTTCMIFFRSDGAETKIGKCGDVVMKVKSITETFTFINCAIHR